MDSSPNGKLSHLCMKAGQQGGTGGLKMDFGERTLNLTQVAKKTLGRGSKL